MAKAFHEWQVYFTQQGSQQLICFQIKFNQLICLKNCERRVWLSVLWPDWLEWLISVFLGEAENVLSKKQDPVS